jgi:hypothetical protein
MTASAPANFATDFDSQIKHEFRTTQPKLMPLTRMRRVTGKTVTFNRMGIMSAQQKLSGSLLQFQDVAQSNVTVNLLDYYAYALSQEEDLDKLLYDEKKELAVAAARGIAERQDQIIINAMDAGASSTTFGADGTNYTTDNLARIDAYLNSINAPVERYLVLHALSARKMMTTLESTSRDYSTLGLIMNGQSALNGMKFMGFNVILFGNLDTAAGGLPYVSATGVRTNYIAAGTGISASVGFGISRDVTTVPGAWLDERDAWKVGARFSAGAVAIGSTIAGREGVYKYLIDELA